MQKLIDADKLKQHYAWWDNEDKKIFDTIVDLQPDAVVRCYNCASWGTKSFKEDEKGEKVYGDCLHFCLATPKWFYCAWGERKEDAEIN